MRFPGDAGEGCGRARSWDRGVKLAKNVRIGIEENARIGRRFDITVRGIGRENGAGVSL